MGFVSKPSERDLLADPIWRLRNLYSCRTEGSGKPLKFTPRPEQEVLFRHLLETPTVPAYVIKSRRLGISTAVDTFQADRAVFARGFRGVIIDQKQEDATKKMVEIVRFAVDSLPSEILKRITFDKRNDSELRLRVGDEKESEDSVIFATTGNRGGDCSMLHVSEWGPIAAMDPERSKEIRTGAFPAARKGRRVVETTWYGGKCGDLWDLVKPILESNQNAEGIVYFFPWHTDPEAVKFTGEITAEVEAYFKDLASKLSKSFSPEQKKWYAAKAIEQGMWVKREYPSTLDEALSVPMEGTIYGASIDRLRANKRICNYEHDPQCPLFTSWDLGISDYGIVWLLQFVGRDILLLDYLAGTGEPASFYASAVKDWERKYGVRVRKHYVPHDANTRDKGTGKTFVNAMNEAGLDGVVVVPRTPDLWLSINERVKPLFPRFYIHQANCSKTFQYGETTVPSGLESLEFYHKKEGASSEVIVHDVYSHGADGLRTICEAYALGMIDGTSYAARDSAAQNPGLGPQTLRVLKAGESAPRFGRART